MGSRNWLGTALARASLTSLSLTEKNQVLYVFPRATVDGQLYTELDPLTFHPRGESGSGLRESSGAVGLCGPPSAGLPAGMGSLVAGPPGGRSRSTRFPYGVKIRLDLVPKGSDLGPWGTACGCRSDSTVHVLGPDNPTIRRG